MDGTTSDRGRGTAESRGDKHNISTVTVHKHLVMTLTVIRPVMTFETGIKIYSAVIILGSTYILGKIVNYRMSCKNYILKINKMFHRIILIVKIKFHRN